MQSSGPFQNGATSGTTYADFDQSYDAINGQDYQSTSSLYTVQAGDTLQSIAYRLWGDSSFWYLIADANGMTSDQTLVAGQDLVIPDKVHNVHNNASTFQVYDPNKAQGAHLPSMCPARR